MQQSIICSIRFFGLLYIPKCGRHQISALYPAEALAGAFADVQHGDMCRHLLGITAEELELALSDLIYIIP